MKTLLDFLVFGNDFQWRPFSADKDELLALVEQKVDFSVKNKDGATILHYLARVGSCNTSDRDMLRVVNYAIECGCTLFDCDEEGMTPIHWACVERNDMLLNYAVESGAVGVFDIQDNDGCTPLHYACARCYGNAWKIAVQHGANPYIKDNKRGLMAHELIATANNPASAKKQLMKTVEKMLSERPQPQPAAGGVVAPPAWKAPAKASDKPGLLGTQHLDVDGSSSYCSFCNVDDRFAIFNTNSFRQIVDLRDGSIIGRAKRNSNNANDFSLSHNGVWYSTEHDDGSEYMVAVDPAKGMDPISGVSLWQTVIGSSQMSVGTLPATDGSVVAVNTSSALIVLDALSGKVLWRGKPKGRTDDTMPVIHDGLVYTQCLVRNKPVLVAFDARTGAPVEERNIELTHPMFDAGWRSRPRRELVHGGKMFYLTQEKNFDIYLAVVDLKTGENLLSRLLTLYDKPFRFRFSASSYGMLAEGDKVYMFVNNPKWTATLNTKTWELECSFFNRSRQDIVKITPDRIYTTHEGEDFASIEIHNRADRTLLHSVRLPQNSARDLTAVVCDSGIIYTCRFLDDCKKVELCIIG